MYQRDRHTDKIAPNVGMLVPISAWGEGIDGKFSRRLGWNDITLDGAQFVRGWYHDQNTYVKQYRRPHDVIVIVYRVLG